MIFTEIAPVPFLLILLSFKRIIVSGMFKSFSIGNVRVDGPVICSPLAGISDSAFRQLARENGAAVVYSEFLSSWGIAHKNQKTLNMMRFEECERPVGIQIFGADISVMAEAAHVVQEAGADILDINMGCPVKKITARGCGAALLKEPEKVYQIVKTLSETVNIPVTVKMRSGWSGKTNFTLEVAKAIEEGGAKAVTVHGRLAVNAHGGLCDFDAISEVKQSVNIPVIGNGGVTHPQHVSEMLEKTGCDAVMVGRAALGNPWFFKNALHYFKTGDELPPPDVHEKISMMVRHLRLKVKCDGERRGVLEMRKHIGWYLHSMPHSARLKDAVNRAVTHAEVETLLKEYEQNRSQDVEGLRIQVMSA